MNHVFLGIFLATATTALARDPVEYHRCRVFTEAELEADRTSSSSVYPFLPECVGALGGTAPLPLAVNSTTKRDPNKFSTLNYNRRAYVKILNERFGSPDAAPAACRSFVAAYACTRTYSICYPKGSGLTTLTCPTNTIAAAKVACNDAVAADIEAEIKVFSDNNNCINIEGSDNKLTVQLLPYAKFTECSSPDLIPKINEIITASEANNCSTVVDLYPEFKAKGCGGTTFDGACNTMSSGSCRSACFDVAKEPTTTPTPSSGGDTDGTSDSSASPGRIFASVSMVFAAAVAIFL